MESKLIRFNAAAADDDDDDVDGQTVNMNSQKAFGKATIEILLYKS